MAIPGCAVASRHARLEKLQRVVHGWVPDLLDMHGIFCATGQQFPAGVRTGKTIEFQR